MKVVGSPGQSSCLINSKYELNINFQTRVFQLGFHFHLSPFPPEAR